MINKIILTLGAFSLLVFTSCGGAKEGDENKDSKAPTVCECMEAMNQMMAEMQEVGMDEAKAKEVEAKYKDKAEACKKLGEGLSEEEQAKLQEEARNCK
jgi:hypothetical protein